MPPISKKKTLMIRYFSVWEIDKIPPEAIYSMPSQVSISRISIKQVRIWLKIWYYYEKMIRESGDAAGQQSTKKYEEYQDESSNRQSSA